MNKERIISDSGEYILSKEPSGVSKITYFEEFLDSRTADGLFSMLHSEIPWIRNSDRYGVQPRKTAWFGKHPYSYSGLTHQPSAAWHIELEKLKETLQEFTGHSFNSVLCNLYQDEHENVGWHADDEPALRENPYIASVSLGESRYFEMQKNTTDNKHESETHVRMLLPTGSLLIMEGSTQKDWKHRIPEAEYACKPRINLTFRTIYDEP